MNEKSLLKTIILYVPTLLIPGLIKWASTPYFTNVLSPAEYAQYAIFMTTIMMASSCNSWLGMSLTRFYPNYEKEGKQLSYSVSVLLFTLLFAVLLSVGVAILFYAGHTFSTSGCILMGLGVFLCSEYGNALLYIARMREKILLYGVYSTWRAMALLVAGGGLAYYMGGGLPTIVIGYFLGLLLILPIVHISSLDTTQQQYSWAFFKDIAQNWLTLDFLRPIAMFGLPLMAAEFAVWGLRSSDRWLLNYFNTPIDVSIYDASYNLMEATVMLVVAVFQVAARPFEVRNWENASESTVGGQVSKMVWLYTMIMIPVSTIFVLVSDLLIQLMLPKIYWNGAVIVPYVVIAIFFLGLQQRVQGPLVYKKQTRNIALGAFWGLAINLTLNILFMPRYAYYAAAINTAIGYSVFCAFVLYQSKKILTWTFPLRKTIYLLLVSAIIFIGLSLLKNLLIAQSIAISLQIFIIGLISTLLYGLYLFLTNEFHILKMPNNDAN